MRSYRPHRLSGVVVGIAMILLGVVTFGRHGFPALGGYAGAVTNTANTAASAAGVCRAAEVAPGTAYFVYPFADAEGTTAVDVSGNGRNGTYTASGVTYVVSGPCDAGLAVALDGTNGAVTGPGFTLALLTFSEVVWFKTTVGGGVLMDVGNAATGASPAHDRALYLSDNGAVNFEVQPLTGPAVITSPSTYKNGAWHLAVGTFSATGGMTLYVDGVQVAANPGVTSALALSGTSYVRIGYDSVSGLGSTAPTNPHVTGSLAYAAAYTSVLSSSRVAAIWAARNQ